MKKIKKIIYYRTNINLKTWIENYSKGIIVTPNINMIDLDKFLFFVDRTVSIFYLRGATDCDGNGTVCYVLQRNVK